MISKPARSTHNHRVPGFNDDSADRVIPFCPADQKFRRVAQRYRYDGDSCPNRFRPLVFVLMKPKSRSFAVKVENTDIRLNRHPCLSGGAYSKLNKIVRDLLNRKPIIIGTSCLIFVGFGVPMPSKTG